MPNKLVSLYRDYLAENGQSDKRADEFITEELAQWAKQEAPEVFEAFPDFNEDWLRLREANAPSLPGEAGRALKQGTIGLASTAVGGLGTLTGSNYLKRKAAAIELQANDPDLAATVPTLEDIHSGRDALRYGIAKTGSVAPSIALSFAGGGLGAGLGAAAMGARATAAARAAGAFRGAVAANTASSVVLNTGDVASEGADTATSIGLGLISAIPDTILPIYVLRKIFPPSVAKEALIPEGKKLLGMNAKKLAEAVGVPAAEFGQEAFQQAVNVVARNIKDGKDPLSFDAENAREIREAGIAGAFGGALATPAVMLAKPVGGGTAPPAEETAKTDEELSAEAVAARAPLPLPTAAPGTPAAVVTQPLVKPRVRVAAMTPEQQTERFAELEANAARTADEEAEFQILLAVAPRATTPPPIPSAPVNPVAVPAPGIAAAPTPVAEGVGLPDEIPEPPVGIGVRPVATDAENAAMMDDWAKRIAAEQAEQAPAAVPAAPVAERDAFFNTGLPRSRVKSESEIAYEAGQGERDAAAKARDKDDDVVQRLATDEEYRKKAEIVARNPLLVKRLDSALEQARKEVDEAGKRWREADPNSPEGAAAFDEMDRAAAKLNEMDGLKQAVAKLQEAPVAERPAAEKAATESVPPADPQLPVEAEAAPIPQPIAITPEQLARPTFEELRGQKVELEGFNSEGTPESRQFDAAEAWADTQKRRNVYQMLLECLKKTGAT